MVLLNHFSGHAKTDLQTYSGRTDLQSQYTSIEYAVIVSWDCESPNMYDTNRPVQAQKRARSLASLKFRIQVEEELYYPSSKNKGGYREVDLRFCFRLCILFVFP